MLFEEDSAKAIMELKISTNSRTSYIWTPSISGNFTTNSAYLAIIHNSLPDISCHQSSVWKELWKLKLNDRLKLFLWKIAWNILPTGDRLQFFQPVSPLKLCPLCKAAEDSLHHLFFRCDIARVIWRNSPWPLDSTVLNFPSMMDWIKFIISPSSLGINRKDHHHFQIFAAVLCDLLWFYRNKAYHDGLLFDALLISRNINRITHEHFKAWALIPSPPEKWKSPPVLWFKINFDTAIRNSYSAQAAVCRNHHGNIIQIVTEISPPCSPNTGEAIAARLAFQLASSLHLNRVIFEGDSQVVISGLSNPVITQDWRIHSLINNIIVCLYK
ncbi:hypothetical protein SLA2020_402740 [Shorea laevis]